MEPEQEEGNVEYKLKLLNKSDKRIQELATQMKYRCEEGGSECIYNLGVEDDGNILGITDVEYEETISVLKNAAEKNKYMVKLLNKEPVSDDRNIYEVLIREYNDDKYIDIKVAVAGSVDVGKSSFLGVMTSGKLDDGRGSARLSIFNYPHEVKTGRTSSIGHHILGFDNSGDIVNYRGIGGRISWPEIVRSSSKIVSFFDLAGHERYLKTTILGLSSTNPDLCLILVGANKGIKAEKLKMDNRGGKRIYDNMTREHIFLCMALGIPFAIIITKIDMVQGQKIENVYEDTLQDIQRLIKCPGIRRQPIKVETTEDVLICAKQVHTESIVPIFSVSNVTGHGIDNVKQFLNTIRKKTNNIHHDTNDVEYRIDCTWSIKGVGTVIGGHLMKGKVSVNDKLFIGPNNGKYEQITIRSIHCKRVPLQSVDHNSYVCFGIRGCERNHIRKGNVLVSKTTQQKFVKSFTANVRVMKSHSTTIRPGYNPIVHISSIRQSAKLIKIENKINSRNPDRTKDDDILRTGDTALITLEFCYYPEFIKPGMSVIMAEGRTKLIGIIKNINV